jgi:hypothetical protein
MKIHETVEGYLSEVPGGNENSFAKIAIDSNWLSARPIGIFPAWPILFPISKTVRQGHKKIGGVWRWCSYSVSCWWA